MGGLNSAPLPGGSGGGDSDLPAGPSFSGPSSPGPSFSDIGGSSLGGLSSGDATLSAPVGPGAPNDPGDVFRVESVLSDADLLGWPPGRSFKDDTFSAIKTAQARLNDDPRVDVGRSPLKLDGLVNPDGPTQAATRKLAGDVLARRAASAPKPQPPKPGTAPSVAPAGPARMVATPSGPRRETLAQTVKRVAKGKPLTPQKPPPKPDMTGDRVAALERLAGGLRKFTHPGPVAKDIADAFRADGPGTVAEFKVVRDVLEKTGTPEQVKNLTEGVRAELSPEDRGRFDRLLASTKELRLGKKARPETKEIRPGGDDPRRNVPLSDAALPGGGLRGGKSGKTDTGPKDDGSNPTFNKFRERLRPREGEFADRKGDRGGPTQKGISQDLLDTLNKQHPEWGLKKDSKDLKPGQIDGIYRIEFFDKPKIQKVQDIPGITKHARELPEQLFDAGVLHGPKRAGQWLQQSLDERLGTDLRVPDKNGNRVYDGNVGPKTRAAIAQALKSGKIPAVNDAMVDRRVDFMRKLPDFKHNPGWLPRANSFRIRR